MQGILFTSDNCKAIRKKRKFQTRRLDHLKEINKEPEKWCEPFIDTSGSSWLFIPKEHTGEIIVKPRYRVGETVYIKEAWRIVGKEATLGNLKVEVQYQDNSCIWYPVDETAFKKYTFDSYGWNITLDKGRSPIFMPAWAARDFIKITGVRPERLNDITEEDAIAEGINPAIKEHDSSIDLRLKFAWLWDSINEAYPFNSNPWVWRYCFNLMQVYWTNDDKGE